VVTDEDDDALYDAIGLHVVPQLLYVAAKLGLADHLHAGPLALALVRIGSSAPASRCCASIHVRVAPRFCTPASSNSARGRA
jgi:hypothetical protein